MSVEEDPGIACSTCRRTARRILTFSAVPANFEWEMVAMKGEPDVPTRVGFG